MRDQLVARRARLLFLVGGLLAATAFAALTAWLGVVVRPVSSRLASGLIGAIVGGTIWCLIFMGLAVAIKRRGSTRQDAV